MSASASLSRGNTISISEGANSSISLIFTGSVFNVSYSYSFSPSTATSLDAFAGSGSGSLSLASSSITSRSINIPFGAFKDRIDEAPEVFHIKINISGATFSDGSTSRLVNVTVLDDPEFHGTNGNDTWTATSAGDTYFGYDGNDRATGRSGDDVLYGGSGLDRLFGNGGNDTLHGEAGGDRLYGGGGRDILFGGAGKDRLFGGAGDDILEGGAGDDMLEGGKGADRLKGGAGNDTFVFTGQKLGRDVIEDFQQGRDVVAIAAQGVEAFADLSFTRIDGDAAVRFAGTVVIFDGIAPGALRASDFDFA